MSKSFLYIPIYNKVSVCPECQAVITEVGNVIASCVAPRKIKAPKPSKHPTVYLGDGVFSVQYWQFHRCFVRVKSELCDTGEDTNFCTKFDCSENRRLAIRNKHQFDCTHIQKVLSDPNHDLVNVKRVYFVKTSYQN